MYESSNMVTSEIRVCQSTYIYVNQAYCTSHGLRDLARKFAHHNDMLNECDDILASSALAARTTRGMQERVH